MSENKFGGICRNAGKSFEQHLCRVPEKDSAASPACARIRFHDISKKVPAKTFHGTNQKSQQNS
jgi:hypothetical protein